MYFLCFFENILCYLSSLFINLLKGFIFESVCFNILLSFLALFSRPCGLVSFLAILCRLRSVACANIQCAAWTCDKQELDVTDAIDCITNTRFGSIEEDFDTFSISAAFFGALIMDEDNLLEDMLVS